MPRKQILPRQSSDEHRRKVCFIHNTRIGLAGLLIMATVSAILSNKMILTMTNREIQTTLWSPTKHTDRYRHRSRIVYMHALDEHEHLRNKRPSVRTTTTLLDVAALQNTNDDNDYTDDTTRLYGTGDSSDLSTMERRIWPRHELDSHCVPMHQWQTTMFPTCNDMHALGVADTLVEANLSLLSNRGFWRHAWRYHKENVNENTTTVLKTFKLIHNLEEAYLENNRVDAIAMERLTSSKRVINIYGFCGSSLMSEFGGKELAHVVDQFNSTKRLEIAIQVAQGLADVHRVNLVYNDLNIANVVMTDRPVLNDFNIAIMLMKHNETGETCPFVSHFPNPQWKAPEEQRHEEHWFDLTRPEPVVTAKIDVYALGNIFFRLAVGKNPWKRTDDVFTADEVEAIAQLKRHNGTSPPVPEEIDQSNDPVIQILLRAMRQTYQVDPADRPSAQQVVDFMQSALDGLLSTKKPQNQRRARTLRG